MLSDPNDLTAGTMTRSSSPDRREERFDTDDVHHARERSAWTKVVAAQKLRDDLDLVVSDQGRRMAAVRDGVDADIAIPSHHVLENGLGKQIRLLPTYHQNGDVDCVPVFPEIDAVVPGVSKGMGDVRDRTAA